MKVLSLFDGISCGQVALERAGFKPSLYMASEIDKEAIKVAQSNYPNTLQLGSVIDVNAMVRMGAISDVDLLIGDSPCQGFSQAGAGKGFDDPRSRLFFNYVNIKDHLKPKWFLLENVRMKKQDMDLITALMGVEPVEIDSALFSAQRRKRIYWTNIPIAPIVDRNISPWMIIDWANKNANSENWHKWWVEKKDYQLRKQYSTIINSALKAQTLTARSIASWNSNLVDLAGVYRFISRLEAERLQTLPENYTKSISEASAHKALGNGWTVDVIAHILQGMR